MLFIVALLPFLTQFVVAHYQFPHLILNKSLTPAYKYVRDTEPFIGSDGHVYSKFYPQELADEDIACGRRAFDNAETTETADVIAGETVGFHINGEPSQDGTTVWGDVYHWGPAQIYLSRAPNDDLNKYRGDGEWFKIAFFGAVDDSRWMDSKVRSYNFTIPLTTPPGLYLLRIEQFWPSYRPNDAQFFVNCAHVRVIGPGGGDPEHTASKARFPGTYRADDPGILVPKNMYAKWPGNIIAEWPLSELLGYQAPGPDVWKG